MNASAGERSDRIVAPIPFGSARGVGWDGPIPPRRPGVEAAWAPLEQLRGVGRVTAERARAFGLASVADLLFHLPARHEDFAEGARLIRDLAIGEDATVRVELDSISVRPTRKRRLRIVQARVHDETGMLMAIWFNRDYLVRVLTPGDVLLLRGKIRAGAPPEMTVQTQEVLHAGAEGGGASEGLHTTGLVPVYPATEALPSRRIRELVDAAIPLARALGDPLPVWMRERLSLPSLSEAIHAVHFPRRRPEARLGRRRLVLGELVILQLGLLALMRREAAGAVAAPLRGPGLLEKRVRDGLPFALTSEQERALMQVQADVARTRPMRRLLQGEVGSGKTLVAVLAMCIAVESDAQAAILVPTETLAEQHLRNLDALLAPTGISPVLLTGRVQGAERERRLMSIRTGTAQVVVGTQALLSEGVEFANLALVVVDEQHRFGVEQRSALTSRADSGRAHVLYMTATPIPRTMALTAFGDLLVSVIRRRPPGRSPVATEWVREPERDDAYARVREELRAGRRAYVICPRVEQDTDGRRSAIAEAERLAAGPFSGFTVGLAHGAQSSEEKRQAMLDFAEGRTDLLVATTVVEVGIDVAEATVIVIEDAERFGLAQLHQLRGRVGRGHDAGLCMLFGEPTNEEGARRLEAMTQVSDGFALAELDLEMRGEGTVLGASQSGATDLRFARVSRDRRELAEARHLARKALERDPRLLTDVHGPLRAAVLERFPDIPRLLEA